MINAQHTPSATEGSIFRRSVKRYQHLFQDGRLTKFYEGKLHVIELGQRCFLYNGSRYYSLSKVVEKIRNKKGRTSPTAFFGEKNS